MLTVTLAIDNFKECIVIYDVRVKKGLQLFFSTLLTSSKPSPEALSSMPWGHAMKKERNSSVNLKEVRYKIALRKRGHIFGESCEQNGYY